MSKFRSALALALALGGLAVLAPSVLASGSAQGPPAGPTSPPFFQCPAIGLDTTCQFLVDVTNTGTTVLQDTTQGFYDGSDDITVAIQNDTSVPLGSIHLGVDGSGDGAFGLDGDGMCNGSITPAPDECPFGPPGNTESPFDYYGPDTVLTPDPESRDGGTVSFTTALQPGQYTYITLEAPFEAALAAGNVNDFVTSSLTDTANPTVTGPVIALPTPADVTDTATIVGPNATQATGTVTYKVYSDPKCTVLVANAGTKTVTAGTAAASNPVGVTTPLANNAKYFWVVEYSGNEGEHPNTPTKSACGNEVMTFGTPVPLPGPTITTVLSGGGVAGAQITVPPNTPVTDNATVTAPGGQPVTGRISYAVYSDSHCVSGQIKGAGGGMTTGSGPASNPLSLPTGTYYFQASYSGNGILGPAVSACGSEILTVAAPPPPPPSSQFVPIGNPQFNPKTGQLVIVAQFPVPGTATATGVVQQGATVARARLLALAEAARRHSRRCTRGFVKKGRRCVNNAPVTYGTTILPIPAPGTFTIIINPSGKVLKALKQGRKLNVLTTTTFLARGSNTPVTHVGDVQVKLKLKKHSRRRRH
ncbi:MAG TPA: hypothetical protein VGY76_07035 [Solirubrobacteraceae bacterium]|jgi:hypothetical protein|nr:hypothetical protein [Solirubrobacteraceae bacterium]